MKQVEVGKLKEINAKSVLYLFHKSGNPIEEALMIQKLMENRTQHDVAKILEITQGQVSKRLRLLQLHPVLQQRLKNGELRASTAYALSKLSPESQKEYVNRDKTIILREVEAKRRRENLTTEVMGFLDKPFPKLPQNPQPFKRSEESLPKLRQQIIEKLAELEHEQWSHWIKYQLEECAIDPDTMTEEKMELAGDKWDSWIDQSERLYSKLSEEEKESDREWARKAFGIVAMVLVEKLQKRIDELNSDDLKNKSWDTWIREYEGFMLAKKELEEFLETLKS